MNGRQRTLPAVHFLSKGRHDPVEGRLSANLRRSELTSLYRCPRFLLECAVRGRAVVVKYLHRFLRRQTPLWPT